MPAQRVGRATGAAAPVGARQDEQADRTQRGHHRLPIRQDRLKKAQAPYCRRHNGTAAGRGGAFSRYSGSSGSQGFADQAVYVLLVSQDKSIGKAVQGLRDQRGIS